MKKVYTLVAEGASGVVLCNLVFDPTDPKDVSDTLSQAWDIVNDNEELWDTHYISYWDGDKCLGRL